MKRILSFDLARGFTVLIMPSIHVVMLYSKPDVQQSLLGHVLAFIAEGPGAQLFMLLMGVSFTFSKRINKLYVLQRAFYLLLAAYALNFFKFIIPLAFGFFPQNLLTELQLENNLHAASSLLLLGDILHFAAIAYLILFAIYQAKNYPFWSALIAIAILSFSPYIWDVQSGNTVIDYVLTLAGGHPPAAFFPLFPWLVYPLMGMTLGHFLKEFNQDRVINKAGLSGLAIIIATCLLPPTQTKTDFLPFYRTEPVDTLFHLGFVFVWLALLHWISRKVRGNQFFNLLVFCSKNITSIYIIQWITICWCLAFTGYLQLNMLKTICWMIGITLFTLLLASALNKSNARTKSL